MKVRFTESLLDKKLARKRSMITEGKLNEIEVRLQHRPVSKKLLIHLAQKIGILKPLNSHVIHNPFKWYTVIVYEEEHFHRV
jgi:hypothetical protein